MPRPKKDGIKVSYILDRMLVEELDKYCKDTGRNKTTVIEWALRLYLHDGRARDVRAIKDAWKDN